MSVDWVRLFSGGMRISDVLHLMAITFSIYGCFQFETPGFMLTFLVYDDGWSGAYGGAAVPSLWGILHAEIGRAHV